MELSHIQQKSNRNSPKKKLKIQKYNNNKLKVNNTTQDSHANKQKTNTLSSISRPKTANTCIKMRRPYKDVEINKAKVSVSKCNNEYYSTENMSQNPHAAIINIFKKLNKLLKGIVTGLKSVFKMKNFPLFIFHSFFIWSMYFLMTWVMVFSLPETSGLGPVDGLFLLVIGSLGMVAPVQGGIGAFHWIVSMGLTLYGIPREKGLVYATISHESQMLLVVILGVISLFIVLMQKKKSYIAE